MNRTSKTILITLFAALCGSPALGQLVTQKPQELLATIQSTTASYEEKDAACRQLAIIGDKTAVAPLAAMLGDAKLSHMARYALETIPDPAVDDALRAALGTAKGLPLVGVIGSIGVRKDAKAVEPLVSLLKSEDPIVAQAAARALGKIGTVEGAKGILAALPNTAPANVVAFCEGLFRGAEALARAGQKEQAIGVYDALRNVPNAPYQVRVGALRGAILSREKEGLALLKENLKSADPILFGAAIATSMEIAGPEVTQALSEALPGLSVDKQILTLGALGKRADAGALPAVSPLAKKADQPIRLAAIRAIGEIASPAALPLLRELMSDADAPVAALAQETLASLPGSDVDAAVMALFNSDNAAQKVLGMDLIGRRRMTGCVPALFKAVGDADAKVRATALRRVGELASTDQLPAVLELFLKAPDSDRDAAEQAVIAICQRAEKPETAVNSLVALVPKATPATKASIIKILSGIGGPEALKAIRSTLADGSADAQVRTAAIRALGTWKSADAVPDLLELAKSGKGNEKLLGLRGMLSIAGRSEVPNPQRLEICKQALPLVERPEEKRQMLGSLSGINSPQALAMIAPFIDDASIKEEACNAAVVVSEKLTQRARQAPKGVHEAMDKVVKTTGNEALKKRANTILTQTKPAGK